jgi:shikimate kinase
MCSGKTTLGRAYALKMGLQFIDLDWYIEGRFHKTVKQIFADPQADTTKALLGRASWNV